MAYEGNIRRDSAVLVGGTKTIADTAVTAASKILISNMSSGGTVGLLSTVITPGVGFTINSANVLDTSTIAYQITY